jgi:hypothetical protein
MGNVFDLDKTKSDISKSEGRAEAAGRNGLIGVMYVGGSDAPSELSGRREQSMCLKSKIEKHGAQRHPSTDFAALRGFAFS